MLTSRSSNNLIYKVRDDNFKDNQINFNIRNVHNTNRKRNNVDGTLNSSYYDVFSTLKGIEFGGDCIQKTRNELFKYIISDDANKSIQLFNDLIFSNFPMLNEGQRKEHPLVPIE